MAQAQKARLLVTLPDDVRRWLRETSSFNGGSQSGEIVRALRMAMAAGAKPPRRKQPFYNSQAAR
jgi:hypothetical protein